VLDGDFVHECRTAVQRGRVGECAALRTFVEGVGICRRGARRIVLFLDAAIIGAGGSGAARAALRSFSGVWDTTQRYCDDADGCKNSVTLCPVTPVASRRQRPRIPNASNSLQPRSPSRARERRVRRPVRRARCDAGAMLGGVGAETVRAAVRGVASETRCGARAAHIANDARAASPGARRGRAPRRGPAAALAAPARRSGGAAARGRSPGASRAPARPEARAAPTHARREARAGAREKPRSAATRRGRRERERAARFPDLSVMPPRSARCAGATARRVGGRRSRRKSRRYRGFRIRSLYIIFIY
jgi:hypothetical protein